MLGCSDDLGQPEPKLAGAYKQSQEKKLDAPAAVARSTEAPKTLRASSKCMPAPKTKSAADKSEPAAAHQIEEEDKEVEKEKVTKQGEEEGKEVNGDAEKDVKKEENTETKEHEPIQKEVEKEKLVTGKAQAKGAASGNLFLAPRAKSQPGSTTVKTEVKEETTNSTSSPSKPVRPPPGPPPAHLLAKKQAKADPKDTSMNSAASTSKVAQMPLRPEPSAAHLALLKQLKAQMTDAQRAMVQTKREQKRAALCVRKAILTFRHATVENMADLHQAMDVALEGNLEYVGVEKDKLQDECERALLLVYKRLEEPLRQREKAEKVKREEIVRAHEQQQAEAQKLETATQKVLEAVRVAKEKVAEAVEAEARIAEAVEADHSADAAEVVLAAVHNTEIAAESALRAVEHAAKAYFDSLREMGNTPAAIKRRSLPDFKDAKKEVERCRLTLKKLAASAAGAREQTEETVRLQSLLKLVRDVVDEAEDSVMKAAEAGADLLQDVADLSSEELLTAAKATEEATAAAHPAIKDASKAIVEKGWEMGQSLAAAALKQAPLFQGLQIRLTGMTNTCRELLAAAKTARARAGGKANVQCHSCGNECPPDAKFCRNCGVKLEAVLEKKAGQENATFSKYDLDGDGFLNRSEVIHYAEEEHKIKLEEEQVERITCSLTNDEGVPKEKFKRLCAMLSIERSVMRVREEKVKSILEEERKQMQHEDKVNGRTDSAVQLAEASEGFSSERTEELLSAAGEAEKVLQQTEEICGEMIKATVRMQPNMARQAEEDDDSITQGALEAVEEVEADVQAGIANLEAANDIAEVLDGVREGLDSSEVVERLRDLHLPMRMQRLRAAFEKAAAEAEEARRAIDEAKNAALASLHGRVACCIRGFIQASGLSVEEVFGKAVSHEDGMCCGEFLQFVNGSGAGLPEEAKQERQCFAKLEGRTEQLEELFGILAGSVDAHLGLDGFVDTFTHLAYHVLRDTAMTKANLISSKAGLVRRLRAGEWLEALALPEVDKSTGLRRVYCRAAEDGAEGWVTIMSNLGTVFLEPQSAADWSTGA